MWIHTLGRIQTLQLYLQNIFHGNITVIQWNGSDLVVLPLLPISTAHKVLTGVLLQLFWMNNPLYWILQRVSLTFKSCTLLIFEMEFSIAHSLQERKSHDLMTCDRRNVNFVKHDLLDVTIYPNNESLYRRRWQERCDINKSCRRSLASHIWGSRLRRLNNGSLLGQRRTFGRLRPCKVLPLCRL